ncbi:hypothetical protein JMJ77_0012574, partial [Colletotrichum scovillei]
MLKTYSACSLVCVQPDMISEPMSWPPARLCHMDSAHCR